MSSMQNDESVVIFTPTVYDEIRYLVLFGSETCDAINNRIRYLTSQKSVVYVFLIFIQELKLVRS